MLGSLQPNLLLSPASNKQQLNLNPNIKISSTNSLQQSSGLDDKSLKDIIEILNRRIENVKYLNEFSQVLQVDNISKWEKMKNGKCFESINHYSLLT
jgi:hypothetical protein